MNTVQVTYAGWIEVKRGEAQGGRIMSTKGLYFQ